MSSGAEKQIRQRVESLTSARKRVHATELFTLAMLPKLRRQAEDAVSYYDHVLDSLANIADTAELRELMAGTTGEGKVLTLLITSSRGMCGPYNRNVFDQLEDFVAAESGAGFGEADFAVLGSKGRQFLERAHANVVLAVDKGLEDISLEEMADLGSWLLSKTRGGTYRKVFVVYTRYLDAMHSQPTTMQLLPLTPESQEKDPDKGLSILDFEGEAATLVTRLVDSYVVGMLYSLLRYSVASEYSERRKALQQASRGIDDELGATRTQLKHLVMEHRTNALLEIVNTQSSGGTRRRRNV